MLMKDETEFTWCADRLKALADPERLRIVTALLDGPKNVGDLADELNDAVVKVSHHLGVLRHSELVTTKKLGRHVEYALHPQVFIVANISDTENFLDLGCCRLELPADVKKKKRG
jgi:DNA-binding transcriptional ArsR family regulator